LKMWGHFIIRRDN